MDGHPRQNPAYRPATEKALETGLFLSDRVAQQSHAAPVEDLGHRLGRARYESLRTRTLTRGDHSRDRSAQQSEVQAAIGQAYLDLLTPAERESVGLDAVAKDHEPLRLGDELECLADREFPLDEGGAGRR
jgi:hypothetical protein